MGGSLEDYRNGYAIDFGMEDRGQQVMEDAFVLCHGGMMELIHGYSEHRLIALSTSDVMYVKSRFESASGNCGLVDLDTMGVGSEGMC